MKVKLVITLMMIAVISFGCGKAENSIPEQEKEETIVQENEEVSEKADTFQKELVEMSKSDVMYSGEIESIDEEYWVDQIASKEEEQKLIEIMKKIPKEDFENAVDYLDMYTLPKEGGLVKFFEDSSKDIVIYGYTCEEFYAKGVIIKDQDVWTMCTPCGTINVLQNFTLVIMIMMEISRLRSLALEQKDRGCS